MPTFIQGLNDTQKQGINTLVQSGRSFNETDAKNYAYATGAKDFSQYVGKTGSQIEVPSTFDAGSLGTGTAFNAGNVQTPADPTPYVQSLADATKQAQTDYQDLLKTSNENSGVNKLESERTGLTGRLQDALSKLTGRGTALQTAEDNLGVTQDLSRLKELNLQVTGLTNEYSKRIAAIPGQGIGLTTGAVAQLTDREKRMAAVEIGGLAAVQSALQGNIALSQQQAERTVNMEFEPYEQEVKNLQTMLELNYDNLDRAEKKQADELGYVLQQRQATIDQQKEDRLSIINMATEAAQQGADTVTLNKILKAGTIEDALAIAGDSLGGEFRAQQEQQRFENALTLRDQALQEAPRGSGGVGGGGGGSVSTTVDPVVQSWVDQINAGKATVSNVPAAYKNAVVMALNTTVVNDDAQEVRNQALDYVKQIESSPALSMSTGFSSFMTKIPGTQSFALKANLDSLIDLLAMENLDRLKGPMSDKDIQFLRNTATKLKLGLPTGEFKKELSSIKNTLNKVQTNVPAKGGDDIDSFLNNF